MALWLAGAAWSHPTGDPLCTIDGVLHALVDVEDAVRQPGPYDVVGERLIEEVACAEPLPRVVAARVLRAIGASQPAADRAAWWSASQVLDPDGLTFYGVDVTEELRAAAAAHEATSWGHLPLAQRVIDDDDALQAAVSSSRETTLWAYSWFPVPRAWGLVGAGTDGAAHHVGGSIGAGTTVVAFGERTWAGDTVWGVGTHSFIGDTYNHGERGGMRCRVLHRHYVRPGLLIGGVRRDGRWNGVQVRPEASLGAFANLLVAVPVTWRQGGDWAVAAQLGLALGLP